MNVLNPKNPSIQTLQLDTVIFSFSIRSVHSQVVQQTSSEEKPMAPLERVHDQLCKQHKPTWIEK